MSLVKKNHQNEGFTLIESMVTLGIASIIGTLVWNTINRQQMTSNKIMAKENAQRASEQLGAVIKRDHLLQPINGMKIIAGGLGLEIERMRPNQSNPNLFYKVQYTSVCKAIPSSHANLKALMTDKVRTSIYGSTSSPCLSKLSCDANSYPTIQITSLGTGAAVYQPAAFPALATNLSSASVGAALCVTANPGHFNIAMEQVVISGEPEAYQASIIKKQLLLPFKTAQDLAYLTEARTGLRAYVKSPSAAGANNPNTLAAQATVIGQPTAPAPAPTRTPTSASSSSASSSGSGSGSAPVTNSTASGTGGGKAGSVAGATNPTGTIASTAGAPSIIDQIKAMMNKYLPAQ